MTDGCQWDKKKFNVPVNNKHYDRIFKKKSILRRVLDYVKKKIKK